MVYLIIKEWRPKPGALRHVEDINPTDNLGYTTTEEEAEKIVKELEHEDSYNYYYVEEVEEYSKRS